MLKEHARRSKVRPTEDDDVLEPDTFWTLIEKLLIRSSVDVPTRQQHNLALTAMCRGRALPRVPRKPSKSDGKHGDPKNVKSNKQISNSKKVYANDTMGVSQNLPKAESTTTTSNTNPYGELFSADLNTSDTQNATKAQSECFVKDLDVVYINDGTTIPVSERLWRYAMKHNKEKTDADCDIPQLLDGIPNARSNEAIYLALKQRLENALLEKERSANRRSKQLAKKTVLKPPTNAKILLRTCKSLDRNDINKGKSKTPCTKSVSMTASPVVKQPQPLHLRHKHLLDKRSKQTPSPIIHNDFQFEINGKSSLRSSPGTNSLGTETSAAPSGHEKMETSKALYDSVLKKRLSCGNQLDTLNKEMVYKKQNPRAHVNRDTTKKYADLKNEYLNLCYQECQLRHQIAILHAEIYMMQNKGFHKKPASIKTINLDSNSANIKAAIDRLEKQSQSQQNKRSSDVLLFPRLKPPKPLLQPPQKQLAESLRDPYDATSDDTPIEEQSDTPLPYIMDGFPAHGMCSVYSLSPQLSPPPKRAPIMTIDAKLSRDRSLNKMSHRLPKMSTIHLLKVAHKI